MKKQNKPTKNEKTLVAFLLDRTGSMASRADETIMGFNGYIDELNKNKESKGITFDFTQFDSISIDVVHDCVPLKDVDRLTSDTYQPRANTPLYDAIGKTIRRVEGKANGFKVLFVTLTDGLENASSEWTAESVRKLIKEKEDKDHWTFSYIGVGPDAWSANQAIARGTKGLSNVIRSTSKNAHKAYGMMARATMDMCSDIGGQSVSGIYGGKQLDQDEE